ncbi:hypothetical protein RCL_jg261.t1 [Rhizophagus clarus]|uniref:Uncharacterized protein n=1 Tax=Rhizophagus clarus TaxID=94130 RepID=A0A8H3QXL1_9GLOM|nr:hypothetical protein RCL_jg261.t1 [Rhizophagus clarus]
MVLIHIPSAQTISQRYVELPIHYFPYYYCFVSVPTPEQVAEDERRNSAAYTRRTTVVHPKPSYKINPNHIWEKNGYCPSSWSTTTAAKSDIKYPLSL